MRIGLGADHAGFELKQFLAKRIVALGHELVDLGAWDYEPLDDYPDFAERVANAVAARAVDRGVLVCGSGIGASIAANKVVGVRAGVCTDTYSAHQGVEHDDVNVLVLGSRILGIEVANEILENFLRARFSGEERHVRRLNKVLAIESRSLSGQEREATACDLTDPQRLILARYESDVEAQLKAFADENVVARFWQKDASLWGGGDRTASIENSLRWLDVVGAMQSQVEDLENFAAEVRAAGLERVVLAGMGGSNVVALVLSKCVPIGAHGLPLTILDSTDPETLLRVEGEGPLDKTLFIIASKSGTNAETSAFDDYFFEKVGNPSNFIAITDPGTPLAESANKRGFRRVFANREKVCGTFSALGYFGLVPAALLGLDLRKLLNKAEEAMNANGAHVPVDKAPAFVLGAALGVLAKAGVDKATFLTPNDLQPFGTWLEQVFGASTGKDGKGILPVTDEESGPPSVYGADRFFIVLRDCGPDCSFLDIRSFAIRDAGHPIATIDLKDPYDIAQEFMRFEFATAVADIILGVNPFDQPNVQESKNATARLLEKVVSGGADEPEAPALTDGHVAIFGDAAAESLNQTLRNFFHDVAPGSYASIHAYLPESAELNEKLHRLQCDLRDELHIAVTKGYGPRLLHSTGQLHKGGPNTGYFIQLTADHAHDAPMPGKQVSWAVFIDAQAQGDREALNARGRHTLRIHLGSEPSAALDQLINSVCEAFAHRAS